MKKTKIIVPALGMLLLSTAASVTGTVAWFSMNNTTTVTGMMVRTKIGDNLYIAGAEVGTGMPASTAYATQRVDAVRGLLDPVSTVDGESFWFTNGSNVAVDGQAIRNEFMAYDKASPSTAWTNLNGAEAVGYVDYVVALKAVNGGTADEKVVLKQLDLTYGGALDGTADDTEQAWRVAMFIQDAGEAGSACTSADLSLVSILGEEESAYFQQGKKIYTLNSAEGTPASGDEYYTYACDSDTLYSKDASATSATKFYTDSTFATAKEVSQYVIIDESAEASSSATAAQAAVCDTNKYNAVQNYGEKAVVGDVEAGTTRFYKVTIRLWLEGEDTTCYNDMFALLNDQWALDLAFTLEGDDTNAVDVISNEATAAKLKLALGTTSIEYKTINGVDYYEYDIDGDKYYSPSSKIAKDSKIYTIDGNAIYEVTNQVEFTVDYALDISAAESTITSKPVAGEINANNDIEIVINKADGKQLPTNSEITVTINEAAYTAYTLTPSADGSKAKLIIPASAITGDVNIVFAAEQAE